MFKPSKNKTGLLGGGGGVKTEVVKDCKQKKLLKELSSNTKQIQVKKKLPSFSINQFSLDFLPFFFFKLHPMKTFVCCKIHS